MGKPALPVLPQNRLVGGYSLVNEISLPMDRSELGPRNAVDSESRIVFQ
jgi:hypothetical protein